MLSHYSLPIWQGRQRLWLQLSGYEVNEVGAFRLIDYEMGAFKPKVNHQSAKAYLPRIEPYTVGS